MDREVNGEAGTDRGAIRALHIIGKNEAVRLLDDSVHSGKPEPGPLPLLLGREERLEYLVEMLFRDPAAGVLDDHDRVIVGWHDIDAHLAHVAGGNPACGQGQAALPVLLAPLRRIGLHRIAGIYSQVDDNLFELLGIGANRTELPIVANRELDLLAHEPLQKLAHFTDHVGQLQNYGAQRLLAAEGEQLPGEAGRPVRIGLDLLDVIVIAVARRMTQQHEIAVTDNGRQHIVEIVCHAACKLADRLHLGRLGHLTPQPLFFRRIRNG